MDIFLKIPVHHEINFRKQLILNMNVQQMLGFAFPTRDQIVDVSVTDNRQLVERKRRILTELAAIETGIDIFDFLDPARDSLQSSVTDAPCSVDLLRVSGEHKIPALNVAGASSALADIVMDMGKNPAGVALDPPRTPPMCNAIVNHAKVFFAQLNQLKEARSGVLTAFSVIAPAETAKMKVNLEAPSGQDETVSPVKSVHPFFPEIKGIRPLLGNMEEQLGAFPHFIRNPPDKAQCEELRLSAGDDWHRKHLLQICGSSSDDEFNPDALLENMASPAPTPAHPPYPHNIQQRM